MSSLSRYTNHYSPLSLLNEVNKLFNSNIGICFCPIDSEEIKRTNVKICIILLDIFFLQIIFRINLS